VGSEPRPGCEFSCSKGRSTAVGPPLGPILKKCLVDAAQNGGSCRMWPNISFGLAKLSKIEAAEKFQGPRPPPNQGKMRAKGKLAGLAAKIPSNLPGGRPQASNFRPRRHNGGRCRDGLYIRVAARMPAGFGRRPKIRLAAAHPPPASQICWPLVVCWHSDRSPVNGCSG
jgi:hypothetical protein